ncbi:MAG: sulfurtransferase [Chloroflexi bacterium]|nr:sulfurtransferase [Chloroflexota bacterium]
MSLISSEALAERLTRPDSVRVVDVRWYLGRPGDGRRAYDAGHIPDSIFVDLDTDLVAPDGPGRHPLPDPATFAGRLGELGIGDGQLVVACDDVGGWVAARLWWMLDDLGHRESAVLDGGLPAWIAAGLPLSTDASPHPAAHLTLAPAWRRTIERDELRRRLGSVTLLDARAAARYRGEIEPIDPVAGHIPTALSAPTDGNLRLDGRFRSPADLAARFAELGIVGGRDSGAVGRDVVTSCGSGVSACHNALAMRVAGLPDPILFPGSFSDWSRSGLPVATGSDPGAPPVE